MNISITGVTGFRNRGVEALVRPIIHGLHKVFPDSSITTYSGSADYDRPRVSQEGVRVVPEGSTRIVRNRVAHRLERHFGLRSKSESYKGWVALEQSDLLVVTGGDVFSSEYGDRSFDHHLVPLRVARRSKVPSVVFAQSIGPFNSSLHRETWLKEAEHVAAISVREARTYNYLINELGISTSKVLLAADPAFLLEPDKRVAGWFSTTSVAGRPLIALSLSQGISSWVALKSGARVKTWISLINSMIEKWGASIVLIPHVQEPHANDVFACTEVWRGTGFSEHVKVLGADFSASEYKEIISQCEMVVAERMHAGIAGLSSCVCTSIVAYSVKARGIVDRVVGDSSFKRGALIEGTDFENADKVWAELEALWSVRDRVRIHLQASVAVARVDAWKAFESLPGVLRGHVA